MVQRNSTSLLESNPDHIMKIFATPDLTPKELEKNKLLKEKFYKLNKAGKFNPFTRKRQQTGFVFYKNASL